MSAPKILAFAGSTRTESFNKKLMRIGAAGARAAGGDVTEIDLRDFGLPLFDEDLESRGTPEGATRLKGLMRQHDAFLISAPEYNSSITAVLKNAIDWASRPAANEPPLVAFRGKVAVLMAASPGQLGGLRGLVHLRAILGNISVLVLPEQRAISKAHERFQPDGALREAEEQNAILGLGARLVEVTRHLMQR